ncbi:uncharacterized protein LOC124409082 [Diprion similis]|uniref:uncharacterized protein LOC124409082 n=1 Tax=Diprion similis TaxID=362088 RepID=UPI001EF98AE3|nr:uncharacterized protein LOC124409082 [Diprion similis]
MNTVPPALINPLHYVPRCYYHVTVTVTVHNISVIRTLYSRRVELTSRILTIARERRIEKERGNERKRRTWSRVLSGGGSTGQVIREAEAACSNSTVVIRRRAYRYNFCYLLFRCEKYLKVPQVINPSRQILCSIDNEAFRLLESTGARAERSRGVTERWQDNSNAAKRRLHLIPDQHLRSQASSHHHHHYHHYHHHHHHHHHGILNRHHSHNLQHQQRQHRSQPQHSRWPVNISLTLVHRPNEGSTVESRFSSKLVSRDRTHNRHQGKPSWCRRCDESTTERRNWRSSNTGLQPPSSYSKYRTRGATLIKKLDDPPLSSDKSAPSSAKKLKKLRHRNGPCLDLDHHYHSDTVLDDTMSPVGASFSTSMKMSFSLSSLQPSSGSLESPEHVRIRTDRLYNSLTKKRKDPEQEQWRRSWGSRDENKDDFWAAIQSNYNYIMDTNLIDSCKEANGELAWDEGDVSTLSWGLKELSGQFSELYAWLGAIQELVYSKEENVLDKSLRAAHTEELRRKAYRRRLFNEQAGKLVARAPTLRDEVAWRVDHLNTKWELVEQIMAPGEQSISDEQDVSADLEHEVKCLRKWLREIESRLQPLSFRVDWSRAELEEKAMEHMVLQRDIEAHGRIVNSVVKLSERVALSAQQNQQDQQQQQQQSGQALRVANSLERRWHLLFLRALEWQCHIEALAARICNKSPVSCRCSSDSDEEPVTKQPRLSRRQSRESRSSSRRSSRSTFLRKSRLSGGDVSDSDALSDNKLTDDGSYFEDELYQLCVMDTRPTVDYPEDLDIIRGRAVSVELGDRGDEGDIEESGASEEERDDMPPTPVVAPTSVNPIRDLCDEVDGARRIVNGVNVSSSQIPMSMEDDSPRRRRAMAESAFFNTSDRKSKNCATFYFKHLDTDSEADCRAADNQSPVADDSSEEEWTYTPQPRSTEQHLTSEQRKTNVVVRLDFGEEARVEERTMIRAMSNDVNGNATFCNGDQAHFEEDDELGKDSEDDMINNKECIRRLVSQAEDLVREDMSPDGKPGKGTRIFPPLMFNQQGLNMASTRAKYARIKEWLKLNVILPNEEKSMCQALDSCDASGECTTGESDVDKQSQSSEDLQSSVATYRQFVGSLDCVSHSVSQEVVTDYDKTPVNDKQHLLTDSSTPKVVMRTKRKSNGPRPWSVSCISQIGNGGKLEGSKDQISQFSISESALHQLVASPPMKSVSLDASGSSAAFNNSSSTLLEETMIGLDGSATKNSSLRRKKIKLRKKHLGRKSESGSDSVNVNHHSAGSDGCSNQQRSSRKTSAIRGARVVARDGYGRATTLVKSGSFSGSTARQQLSLERSTVSDPAPPGGSSYHRRDESTSETEDEPCPAARLPISAFKGNLIDTVLFSTDLSIPQINVDSDVEKNSFSNNSFSEQAWDNYQEKYMSEPYSEAPDSEAARRLLEFGDDYRNFLDSQSDCASSLSARREVSPPLPRKRKQHGLGVTTEDSDSDIEDLRSLVEKSQSQLVLSEGLLSRPARALLLDDDCAEVESTCKENVRCLRAVLEAAGGALRGERNTKQIRSLIERWESLSTRAEEARRAAALHRDMAAMRVELRAAHDRLLSYEVVLDQHHLLDERINQVTGELATLRERKTALLALNVTAHRLVTDAGVSGSPALTALKDEVADLYRVWDETFQKGNQQLSALQSIQQFAARLTELQSALRKDKDTLAVLDAALQAGAASEVASSVRDVARLLSEKQDICCQNGGSAIKDATITEASEDGATAAAMVIANGGLQEGGSLSDSGISDSGSEQELSERERRLAALRRLARTLEAQLAPGSEALVELAKRVESAEAELRGLQKQCRELIVRTAASVEARAANRSRNLASNSNSKRKKNSKMDEDAGVPAELSPISISGSGGLVGAGDPDSEPGRPHGWVWRVLRAALPFQLALVALFCAACLLEPHCCEAANTLNLSLTPQLRYVRGPPPV